MQLHKQGFIELPLVFITTLVTTVVTGASFVIAPRPSPTPAVRSAETSIDVASLEPTTDTSPIASPIPTPEATPQPTPEPSPDTTTIPQLAEIIAIKDPITYEVLIDGKVELVRLIGLRLPITACETKLPIKKRDLLYLVSDPVQSDRDPGGNLYRYAYLEDETMVNQKLIAEGLAQTYNFLSSPYLYESEFAQIQQQAQAEKRGMWTQDACQEKEITELQTPLPSPTPTTSPLLTSLLDHEINKDTLQKTAEKISKNIREMKKSAPKRLAFTLLASQPATPGASLDSEVIFNLINEHRVSIGKPAFIKDERICSIAQSRGPELFDEIFVTHTMHAGFYGRNLPYRATENLAHFGSESIIVNWWLNSPVHRKAIESDFTYSCGACLGNSCSQIFTSFEEK